MKILLFSDIHRNTLYIRQFLDRIPDADMAVFLGDGYADMEFLLTLAPQYAEKLVCVRGNCDFETEVPTKAIIALPENHRLYAAHGHIDGIAYDPIRLAAAAKENGCDIAACGHTHVPMERREDGIYLINPGSAAQPRDGGAPSCGILDVSAAGITSRIIRYERHHA